MNILHICVSAPYSDGWNYQENVLTKYHVLAGHQVSLLGSQCAWNSLGQTVKIEWKNYKNEVGVMVYRLPIKGNKDIFYRYKRFVGFYETIVKVKPDIIFVHNIQFMDIDKIVQYAKMNKVTIFADNHADFSNSARSMLAKLFYKTVWRYYAVKIAPFTDTFYGVTPSRVEFLTQIYGLPKNKCRLLVMGGDDELIEKAANVSAIKQLREKFEILDKDFLIITGGKIDSFKTQTILLIQAIIEINKDYVKLLIFGSVAHEIKDELEKLVDGSKVINVGWIASELSYDYFAAADLVVFPGRHSVFWEQVVSQGIPMVCKYWNGINHVDIGGNVVFLQKDSVDAIKSVITELCEKSSKYDEVKRAALHPNKNVFFYSRIAERAIKGVREESRE